MSKACDLAATSGRFVGDGGVWRFEGALTFENAAVALAASEELPLPQSGRVDLAGLAPADSAALAVIMALHRRAAADGRSLHIEHLPAALQSLAVVYGIDELVRGLA